MFKLLWQFLLSLKLMLVLVMFDDLLHSLLPGFYLFFKQTIQMKKCIPLDLSICNPDNNLWSLLVEKLGSLKAQMAVRQALDLQYMYGTEQTLPVLFIETCGLGLISIKSLQFQTGYSCNSKRMILIFSFPKKSFQLLYNTQVLLLSIGNIQ